jgi:hypothetical protein
MIEISRESEHIQGLISLADRPLATCSFCGELPRYCTCTDASRLQAFIDLGVDIHSLSFYRWLVANGRHPEMADSHQ